MILFNSKTFHPKLSDSNNMLMHTYNNPNLYHLRHGVPYPKQWVQQRWLAESLMRDKLYTKSTASVRPQELWWNGKDTYYNKPTLDFNHMLIYNLYDISSSEYQPSEQHHHADTKHKHAFRSGPNICIARFARYFGLSELRHYNL